MSLLNWKNDFRFFRSLERPRDEWVPKALDFVSPHREQKIQMREINESTQSFYAYLDWT